MTYVFVEVKTDKIILKFYIKMSNPDLLKKLKFVPFVSPARKGGKDTVSEIVKAIIHLNLLEKKVVALFDNDTEGLYTKDLLIKELESSNIDMKKNFNNIKILSYPNISSLSKYPVYNTNVRSIVKVENDDINGRAAAIELYLPDKLLKDKLTKKLFPIRWYSFNENVNKHQGKFHRKIKKEIQDNFNEFKSEIEKNKTLFIKEEWGKCESIVKLLLK